MIWVLTVLVFLVLMGIVYLVAKLGRLSAFVAKVDASQRVQTDNVFAQVEALLAVYRSMDGKRPLPPTRGWAASPDLLAVATKLVLSERPQVIVELGSGVSTLVIAQLLAQHGSGHLYSFDHDPAFAMQTKAELRALGVDSWVTLLDAPIVDVDIDGETRRWYDTSALSKGLEIGLLLIDGPPFNTAPMARYPAVPHFYDQLADGAFVVLDDADRDDERSCVKQWCERYTAFETVRPPRSEKGCVVLRKIGARAQTNLHKLASIAAN